MLSLSLRRLWQRPPAATLFRLHLIKRTSSWLIPPLKGVACFIKRSCEIKGGVDIAIARSLSHTTLFPHRTWITGSQASLVGRTTTSGTALTSCSVCNNLKSSFDPSPDQFVTAETFDACVARAREYVWAKRDGTVDNSYFRDYDYWLNELARDDLVAARSSKP